jgi:uncharacterized membrane protein YhaH (DUF805 family)
MKKYAVFSGRASRKEYWYFFLIYLIISIITSMLDVIIGTFDVKSGIGPISGIFYLATLLPALGIAIRRLHDTNRAGWWVLLLVIPLIGLIWYIVLLAKAGDITANKYGQVPAQAPRHCGPVSSNVASREQYVCHEGNNER